MSVTITRRVVPPAGASMVRCPWCTKISAKDDACNWVVCGVFTGKLNQEQFAAGCCGRQFCFLCGRKLCAQVYDPTTGDRVPGAPRTHTAACCPTEPGFTHNTYCCGGHNSHTALRWADDGVRAEEAVSSTPPPPPAAAASTSTSPPPALVST